MFLVGLTGGFASGKSTIAQLFKEQGAKIIDADSLARIVVQPGRVAWKDIVRTFGQNILCSDGTLDRRKLAHVVFGHPQKLQTLNKIIHPRVAREQSRLTRQLAKAFPNAVIIYDAALLIEADAHQRMDCVIVVSAKQDVQLIRARQRDGLTQREALQRIRQQLPLRQKRRYADIIIDGTLPILQLRPIIAQWYQVFCQQAQDRTITLPVNQKTSCRCQSLH